MRKALLSVIAFALVQSLMATTWFDGNDTRLHYTGRVQTLSTATRLWTPGVYLRFSFKADTLKIVLNDQMQYGIQHNYMELQIDDKAPVRIRLQHQCDTLIVPISDDAVHTALLCKNTESNIGYVDVVGIVVDELVASKDKKKTLIEFFGDSITCGASADTSDVKCGAGRWEDQHNAFMAYGPVTARKLNADWVLSSVSGIGLMHSCCGMNVVLPQVFDKIVMNKDSLYWHFKSYTPDVVVICLGQNDGIQDSVTFQLAYLGFLKGLRKVYPKAKIILLTSPMADAALYHFLKNQLAVISKSMKASGDNNVFTYFFKGTYNHGCDFHPSVGEHESIANELVAFIRKVKLVEE